MQKLFFVLRFQFKCMKLLQVSLKDISYLDLKFGLY